MPKPQTSIHPLSRWLAAAADKSILLRSVKTACVVGCILAAINHGPELLAGSLEFEKLVRILLTFLIPFSVATFAGVAGKLSQQKQRIKANDTLDHDNAASRELLDTLGILERMPFPVLQVTYEGMLMYFNPAANSIQRNLNLSIGGKLPSALRDPIKASLKSPRSENIKISCAEKIFELQMVSIPEHQLVNLYAVDVNSHFANLSDYTPRV
jgi:hypothetical protein